MSAQNQPQPSIQVQKLYLKEASFQIPEGSRAFQLEWHPELSVDLNTETQKLPEPDTYDVTLKAHCTVKCKEVVAFVAEVSQAAVVLVSHMPEAQLPHLLGAYCPTLLYPYLREVVSEMVLKGGFPQLSLSAVNFEALFLQQQQDAQPISTQKH